MVSRGNAAGRRRREPEVEEACWLCTRPLGHLVEWHHPLPKSRGGRVVVPVHPICHRTIHTTFSNGELACSGGTAEALRADPRVARFLRWVADKPPDFHAPTRRRR
jgi:hypothetical protein